MGVAKRYGMSHKRWNAYMKALHGNGSESGEWEGIEREELLETETERPRGEESESDGWNSDVEREVSRETEEMRGEPQLQPESLPSLRARAGQVAALFPPLVR